MKHKKAKLLKRLMRGGAADVVAVSDEEREEREDWQIRVKEVGFEQYKLELDAEVAEVQRVRREQLRKKYPSATFQTLDGREF
jgi:SOS response regulatory protein OraA/RecX